MGSVSSNGRTEPLKLVAWYALPWGEVYGSRAADLRGFGTDAESFYQWLPTVLRKGVCTWIWQMGACAGLTMLDFWRRLETGLWALDGADPIAPEESVSGNGKPWRGMCVIDDPPTIILARPAQQPGLVRWVDVRNLGIEQWSDIAHLAGTPQAVLSPLWDGPEGEMHCCIARAEAIKHWLSEWSQLVSDLNLGGLRHTAAAQAWHGWRYGYLDSPCLIHGNVDALRLERLSLHAGRCEAFTLGINDGPIYHLDASSMYPACAVANPLPSRLGGFRKGNMDYLLSLLADGWQCIADCTILSDRPQFPRRYDNLTTFPVGRYRTVLAGPELHCAIERNCLVDVQSVAYYEPHELFTRYVASLWDEREKCTKPHMSARRMAVKRLLNSVIGRTAQRGWKWVECHSEPTFAPFRSWVGLNPRTNAPCRWRTIGWHTQYEDEDGEHPESCPAVASWVYSLARIRLLKWIETAGWENVLYVDTDSLFVLPTGYHRLHAAGEIGYGEIGTLSLRNVWEYVDLRGFKAYNTESKIVAAGVPRGAEYTSVEGYSFWVQETIKESLPLQRPPRPIRKGYRADRRNEYRHGVVGKNGKVTPHYVWEVL